MELAQHKIVLIGDGGVGKTTFVRSFRSDFEKKYLPTIGAEVIPLKHKNKVFNVWDCAGQEKFGVLKSRYYIGVEIAIVMYDASNIHSQINVENWIASITKVNPNVKILLLRNKTDLVHETNTSKDNELKIIPFKYKKLSISVKDSCETKTGLKNVLDELVHMCGN